MERYYQKMSKVGELSHHRQLEIDANFTQKQGSFDTDTASHLSMGER